MLSIWIGRFKTQKDESSIFQQNTDEELGLFHKNYDQII